MGKIQSVDAISYDRSTSNDGNIVALDESTQIEGLLYIGTDDGLIQVSKNEVKAGAKRPAFRGYPETPT
ncbi:MAG: hypothetical protein U5L96_10155 [Owenweeksia sp.]|nr:hypothetical protein [Owenweeksia sp.]